MPTTNFYAGYIDNQKIKEKIEPQYKLDTIKE